MSYDIVGERDFDETIESQTQQDQTNSGLPNLAVDGRKKGEVRAVVEAMADLGVAHEETPSDDMTEFGHVSKQIKLGLEGEGLPHGSPKRVDSDAKSTTEDPMGRQEMKYLTGAENLEESSAEILVPAFDALSVG